MMLIYRHLEIKYICWLLINFLYLCMKRKKDTTQPWYANQVKKQRLKRQGLKQFLLEIKKALSCVDCGLPFKDKPWLVDFHHKDPALKLFEISNFGSRSKEIILLEVAKCDALCSNCHRTRHALEQNSVYALSTLVA